MVAETALVYDDKVAFEIFTSADVLRLTSWSDNAVCEQLDNTLAIK